MTEPSNFKTCNCEDWTKKGRHRGIIRRTLGGFALVGWRETQERLEEPDADAVTETLFSFCPWCGCVAR